MSDRLETMQEALQRIVQWSEAYPLDTVSASCMRRVVEGVGKIAHEALEEPMDDAVAVLARLNTAIMALQAAVEATVEPQEKLRALIITALRYAESAAKEAKDA